MPVCLAHVSVFSNNQWVTFCSTVKLYWCISITLQTWCDWWAFNSIHMMEIKRYKSPIKINYVSVCLYDPIYQLQPMCDSLCGLSTVSQKVMLCISLYQQTLYLYTIPLLLHLLLLFVTLLYCGIRLYTYNGIYYDCPRKPNIFGM